MATLSYTFKVVEIISLLGCFVLVSPLSKECKVVLKVDRSSLKSKVTYQINIAMTKFIISSQLKKQHHYRFA